MRKDFVYECSVLAKAELRNNPSISLVVVRIYVAAEWLSFGYGLAWHSVTIS